MNAGELYDHWRKDIFDTAEPYLWDEAEVWAYMLDAYRMFVRLTGGIADFTSEATRVEVVLGESVVALDPRILRIMQVMRLSDGGEVEVLNLTDLSEKHGSSDYGAVVRRMSLPREGRVSELVIGRQKGVGHLTVIPVEEDTLQLAIYRLPLETALTEDFTFEDIGDEHVIHLGSWMKHLAFSKDDVETQNLDKAKAYEEAFRAYCSFTRREWERSKHKTRVIGYGGI